MARDWTIKDLLDEEEIEDEPFFPCGCPENFNDEGVEIHKFRCLRDDIVLPATETGSYTRRTTVIKFMGTATAVETKSTTVHTEKQEEKTDA